MSKLSPARPDDVIRVLERRGFREVRQKGSHLILRNAEGKRVTVAIHRGKEIPVGTLRHILKDAAIPPDEFMEEK